jgi:hypothetical protein
VPSLLGARPERRLSLSITKIEEALLWMWSGNHLDIPKPEPV